MNPEDQKVTEQLLSMIVDKTFKNHGIDTVESSLTPEENAKLLETLRILRIQAEKFIAKPSKRIISEGTGATKYMPEKKDKNTKN